jgi:hypothetical protein
MLQASNYSNAFKEQSGMCIYCGTTKYRKIYENHCGSIPKDETGRTYEIHHIDGNKNNNIIDNLQCVSIQEHYDIHYNQGDWFAALRIAASMKIPHEELSRLASLGQKKLVKNGNHNFQGRGPSQKLLAEGKHSSQNLENIEKRRQIQNEKVLNGVHPWLKENGGSELARTRNLKMVANGTHPLIKENGGSEIARKRALDRLANGTHNMQQILTCPHCNKIGKGPVMKRYHFDNCKQNIVDAHLDISVTIP